MTTEVVGDHNDQCRSQDFAFSSGEVMDGRAVVIVVLACIVYQCVRIDVHDRCRCVVVQARVARRFLAKDSIVLYQPAM